MTTGNGNRNGSGPQPFSAPIDSRSFGHDDEDVVVVIGSGAGGGTIANELCQQGVRVVVLEAGPHLTGRRLRQRRVAGLQPDGLARPAHDVGHAGASRATSRTCPAWTVKAVGGTTTHWAGACPRFKEYEFRAQSTYGGGIDGANLLDWPIDARRAGAVLRQGRDQDGRDAPPRPPAAPGEQQLQGVRERRRARRLHAATRPARTPRTPSPTTAGRRRSRTGSTSRATSTAPSGRRSSPSCRRRARPATSTCGPNCQAVQITHDARGRARRRALPRRRRRGCSASARGSSCVAGNAIETARLLLLSASPPHPDGLANSSGQVGRNYMRHVTGVGLRAVRQAGAHVPRRDDGRHRRRRGRPRPGPRLRGRLLHGDALARPAVPRRVRRARRVGPGVHRDHGRLREHRRACGSSARTCRRRPTGSRSTRR